MSGHCLHPMKEVGSSEMLWICHGAQAFFMGVGGVSFEARDREVRGIQKHHTPTPAFTSRCAGAAAPTPGRLGAAVQPIWDPRL